MTLDADARERLRAVASTPKDHGTREELNARWEAFHAAALPSVVLALLDAADREAVLAERVRVLEGAARTLLEDAWLDSDGSTWKVDGSPVAALRRALAEVAP